MPVIPMPIRGKQRQWAQAVVTLYKKFTKDDDEDAVSDLIGDLMHWCDKHGQDPMEEVKRGIRHYFTDKYPSSWPKVTVYLDE